MKCECGCQSEQDLTVWAHPRYGWFPFAASCVEQRLRVGLEAQGWQEAELAHAD
jgi:hypothetical protein